MGDTFIPFVEMRAAAGTNPATGQAEPLCMVVTLGDSSAFPFRQISEPITMTLVVYYQQFI